VTDVAAILDAARDYVGARVELAGADLGGMLGALVRVDTAWHALHLACGTPCADTCPEVVP
jgi:hypothetical protein